MDNVGDDAVLYGEPVKMYLSPTVCPAFTNYLFQTTSVLDSFLLAMVLNPEVFKKAQEEIDRVIGRDRLPDFEDRGSLPYLECVMKEVYRCVWSYPGGSVNNICTIQLDISGSTWYVVILR